MEKVYRLLPWLDMAEAVDYLQGLTDSQINSHLLLQFCESKQCRAYADVSHLIATNRESSEQVCVRGIHLVMNPVDAFGSGGRSRVVSINSFDDSFGYTVEWSVDLPPWKRGPIFQPSDIEALAAKINGVEDSAKDAEVLRQQFEQEQAALLDRAEKAEQMVVSLNRQLTLEKGLLLTIAGLLELLIDRARPPYNQGAAAKAIADKGWRGLGERQINGAFSSAKKAAKEARKEAVNKAESIQDNNKSQHDPS